MTLDEEERADESANADPLEAANELVAAADRVRTIVRRARRRVDGMITSRAIIQDQPKLGRALVRLENLVDRANQICAMTTALRAELQKGI